MFNAETLVKEAMEDLTEDRILVMFPESRHYEKIDAMENALDAVAIESGENCEDLIETMLKDTDPELLPIRSVLAAVSSEIKESDNKELAHALDVQLESLGETLQRLRYYLHEIEQFLPEKNRRRK